MRRGTKVYLLVGLVLLVSLACSQSFSWSSDQSPSQQDQVQQEAVQVATPTTSAMLPSAFDAGVAYENQDLLVQLYDNVSQGVVAIQTVGSLGEGLGSGFVYDNQGNIVTNYHVVEGAEDLEVDFTSGYKARATLVAIDLDSDLAVIKVDVPADILSPLALGDSDEMKVGQTVVAIGNPFGLTSTMTMGIISAKGRTMESFRDAPDGGTFTAGDLIQTDASINPGNSGGPLLNLAGQIIGLNRAIRTTDVNENGDPLNSGIGFAVSSNVIRKVVPALIADGSYDYPYMGVSARDELTLPEWEAIGLENFTGAYVMNIVSGSPAEDAGLRAGSKETDIPGLYAGGDLIVGIDDVEVRIFGDLLSYLITQKSPGDQVNLKVLRNGEEKEITITLGKRP